MLPVQQHQDLEIHALEIQALNNPRESAIAFVNDQSVIMKTALTLQPKWYLSQGARITIIVLGVLAIAATSFLLAGGGDLINLSSKLTTILTGTLGISGGILFTLGCVLTVIDKNRKNNQKSVMQSLERVKTTCLQQVQTFPERSCLDSQGQEIGYAEVPQRFQELQNREQGIQEEAVLLRQQIQVTEGEKQELTEHLTRLGRDRADLHQRNTQLTEYIQSADRERATLGRDKQQLEERLRVLDSEKEQVTQRKNLLEAEKRDQDGEVLLLRGQLLELEARLTLNQAQIREKEVSQEQLQALQSEKSDLSTCYEQLRESHDEISVQLGRSDQTIRGHIESNHALQVRIDTLEQQISALVTDNEKLTREVLMLKAEVLVLQGKLTLNNAKILKVEHQAVSLEEQRLQFQTEKSAFQSTRGQLEDEYDSLEQENQTLQSQLTELRAQYAQLSQEQMAGTEFEREQVDRIRRLSAEQREYAKELSRIPTSPPVPGYLGATLASAKRAEEVQKEREERKTPSAAPRGSPVTPSGGKGGK